MKLQVIFFDLGDTLVKSPRAWQPGAQTILTILKSKGFRLGIISNTTGMPDRVTILKLLPPDFDLSVFEPGLVLFSSEVGIDKPNKGIFNKAVAAAGIPAAKCLYCSEDAGEVLAAQDAGLRSKRIIPGSEDLLKLENYIAQINSSI